MYILYISIHKTVNITGSFFPPWGNSQQWRCQNIPHNHSIPEGYPCSFTQPESTLFVEAIKPFLSPMQAGKENSFPYWVSLSTRQWTWMIGKGETDYWHHRHRSTHTLWHWNSWWGIIVLNGHEYKFSHYADDTSLTLGGSEKSLYAALDTLEFYARLSGLKNNSSKTKIIWIGSKKISSQVFPHVRWKLG